MLKRGFTVIELITVVAIIGILASIIVASLNASKASGRDAKRVSDIKNIQLSLSLYYNDQGHFPCAIDTTVDFLGSCAPDFYPGYMAAIPRDPLTNNAYLYSSHQTTNLTNGDGQTCVNKTVVYYHLAAIMETQNFASRDDDRTLAQQIGLACNQAVFPRFDGNATNCVGVSAVSPDTCYDVSSSL